MISGCATSEGTKNFSKNSQVNQNNFKIFENLHLSNVGIGTYLGNPDSQTDELVKNAVKQSILSGVTLLILPLIIVLKKQNALLVRPYLN